MDFTDLLLRLLKPKEAQAVKDAPLTFVIAFAIGAMISYAWCLQSLNVKDDLIKGYQERLHDLVPHNSYQKYSDDDLVREALRVAANIRALSDTIRTEEIERFNPPLIKDRGAWNQRMTEERKFQQQIENKYGVCCESEAIALRDEMESRLPPTLMTNKSIISMYDWTAPMGFDSTATDLERLAKALQHPEPSCFWFSWIPVSLGITVPWMLLLMLRASLARRNLILDSSIR
jgi:hypothetical protein